MNVNERPVWESTMPGRAKEPWVSNNLGPEDTAHSVFLRREHRKQEMTAFFAIMMKIINERESGVDDGHYDPDAFTQGGSWNLMIHNGIRAERDTVGVLEDQPCGEECVCVVCDPLLGNLEERKAADDRLWTLRNFDQPGYFEPPRPEEDA